ncbi:MAG: sulfotransferase [Pseudomonadales bacterium]|nr:sulfotransferase [Pseudomonadales bacterium]MBO7007156.1 sulfotransferase [Pseudomonadales bacterium]
MTSSEQLQQLIAAGKFEEALQQSRAALLGQPGDVDLQYMTAVCHRYLHQFDDALARLRELKRTNPEFGRAYQEEGHVYLALNKPDDALRAFSRACHFNPALVVSWRAQLSILQSLGRAQQVAFVEGEIDYLQQLPPVLLAVVDLVSQGKLLKAEDYCRKFLQRVPDHVEGMRLLADIGSRLGVLDDADFLLESALAFEPSNARVRKDYVGLLRKKQQFQAARAQARLLLEQHPENLQFRSIHAIECMQCGDYDTAIAEFDDVLKQAPGDPFTLTSKGHALKTTGGFDAAVEAYTQAVKNHPGHGEAYYSLANLKTYQFPDHQVAQMEEQAGNSNLSHMDRIYLSFALGKAFEDRQNFDASFTHYAEGNRLKKIQSRYSAEQMSEEMASQKTVCTADLFKSRSAVGDPSRDPIFILGLPRAGSTLLEQILASHSQVDGTLELPNILSIAHELRHGDKISSVSEYPGVLLDQSSEQLRSLGERYIRDTRVHRQGAPMFIDKMPNNFRHIGLIKLILPNAKIIDARRDPMACCFSGFKQLFAEGQEFTYSLEDVGRYYLDYVDLMNHWHEVLPGEIITVQHEAVVADLESEVRRILEYCGLPFEEQCLRYYETERAVRTPSSEQVRQPIFSDALEQWRNYEQHLTPLKMALGVP